MNRQMRAMRPAFYGLMTALSMVLAYAETLLPSIGIPGAKIGLPNIVTVLGLYTVGFKGTAAVSILRIVLVGLSFGNPSMMIYSLSGWVLSMAAMTAAKRTGLFTPLGVSVAGGVAHNLGQLICACVVLESTAILAYFPFLLPAGVAAGAVVGVAGGVLTERIKKYTDPRE